MDIRYSPKEADIPSHLNKMRSLYKDLFSHGKHYRGALVHMVSEELKLDEKASFVLSQTAEFIHNSSLLHDDVVDNSILRRGKTAAWKKYGGGYAVLAGDYLLARVIKDLCQFSNLELVEFTSDTILALVEGEWLQDDGHNKTDLDQSHISEVHRLKTGALFSWCFKAPFILNGADQKEISIAVDIGELFGALLQRSDDLLDFNIRNFEDKDFFKDLPSGNMNLFAHKLLEHKDNKEKSFEFENLEDFVAFYKVSLESTLKDYDDESVKIISNLKSRIDSIKSFSSDFKEQLKSMGELIYWRK